MIKKDETMYKKIETYNWCDIYKHIDAGVYISAFDGEKIAQGSYLKVKAAILDYLEKAFCPHGI